MDFLYKSKNAIAVLKPVGIPSQPDPTGDEDIMTMTSAALRAAGEPANLWLVHRLDRVVGGAMIFARTASAAAELSAIMSSEDLINKQYLAVVEGEIEDGIFEDYIFKDKLKGKAYITDRPRRGVKHCKLVLERLSSLDNDGGRFTLVRVSLHTGRFHQIRAQLSHRGTPIVGDKKYGSRSRGVHTPALFAYKLDIKMKNETASVTVLPDTNSYPWSLFVDCLEDII